MGSSSQRRKRLHHDGTAAGHHCSYGTVSVTGLKHEGSRYPREINHENKADCLQGVESRLPADGAALCLCVMLLLLLTNTGRDRCWLGVSVLSMSRWRLRCLQQQQEEELSYFRVICGQGSVRTLVPFDMLHFLISFIIHLFHYFCCWDFNDNVFSLFL